MPGGRPSKYESEVKPKLLQIEAWARDGLTMEQIAANLGIYKSTLYEYQNKYKELKDALKKGREVADIQVENALYKTALGYEVEEKLYERNEAGELEVVRVVKKEVQPSNTAQIFWLKNRRPSIWRDRKEIQADTNTTLEIDGIKNMSTEEIKKLLAADK